MKIVENSSQSNTENKIEYYQPIDWDGFTLWDESTANQPIGNPDDGICDFPALITMIQQNSGDTANTGTITSIDMYRALGVPDVRESLEKIVVKNKSEWHKENNNNFKNWLKRNAYKQPEIDNMIKCVELQQFGNKVKVLENNSEVYHYHPAMFVEQMKLVLPRVTVVNPYEEYGLITPRHDLGYSNYKVEVIHSPGFAPAQDKVEKPWFPETFFDGKKYWAAINTPANVFYFGTTTLHLGLDFAGYDPTIEETKIYSLIYGTVWACTWQGSPKHSYPGTHGFGRCMIIKDDNDSKLYILGHLHDYLVEPRKQVIPGQPVAILGNTGYSDGAHLHLEVRECTTSLSTDILGKDPTKNKSWREAQDGNGLTWTNPQRVNPFNHSEKITV